jgi:hypothetical protein
LNFAAAAAARRTDFSIFKFEFCRGGGLPHKFQENEQNLAAAILNSRDSIFTFEFCRRGGSPHRFQENQQNLAAAARRTDY